MRKRESERTNDDAVLFNTDLALAHKDGAVDPGVLGVGGGFQDRCCLATLHHGRHHRNKSTE